MRIATDISCQRPELPVVPYLAPFFPERAVRGETGWESRFDQWAGSASSSVELVDDIGDADLVVIPTDWYWVRGTSWASRPDRSLARRNIDLHERAAAAGKPTLVFFTGDRSCDRVPMPGAHVFREGPYRSRAGERDHALPAFAEDLLAEFRGAEFVARPWTPRPTVGFCGLAGVRSGVSSMARLAVYRAVVWARERRVDASPYLGENLRSEALDLLARSSYVDTNFVIRDSSVFFRTAEVRDLMEVRREYVDNLAASDYVLCIRGSGNYSYRLYEAMSMGRTPIIVDTDLMLPSRERIDWMDVGVWVDPADLGQLDEVVAEHHLRVGEDGFVERQRLARTLWEQHLSPAGFLPTVEQVIDVASS